MDKEKFQVQVMDYLSGLLDENEQMEFEDFLEDYPEQKGQFQEIQAAWNRLDKLTIPEPSMKMDARFYEMLHSKIGPKEGKSGTFENQVRAFLRKLWRPQLAYGMLLLCIGLGIGYFLNSGNTSDLIKTSVVSNTETEEIREKLVLTLLEQPSANKRLQGVSEANKIKRAEEKVIKALLQTLNNDPNVNVRLAAIESLTNYVGEPLVRQGLVQSIVQQRSPIVQVTLANLMVALQEKESVESFKKLMQVKEMDSSVKKKLEHTIQQII